MADDDKQDDSAADPWAGIESSSSSDLSEGLGFSFDEPAEPKGDADLEPFAGLNAESSEESPAVEPMAEGDDDVGDWLQEDAASPAAALSVFSPDEPAVSDDDIAAMLDGATPAAEPPTAPEFEAAAEPDSGAAGASNADDFFGQAVAEEPAAEFPFAADELTAENAEQVVASSESEDAGLPWGSMEEEATETVAATGGGFDFAGEETSTQEQEETPLGFATDEGSPAAGDLFSSGVDDAVTAGAAVVGAAAGGAAMAAAQKAKPVGKKPVAKPAKKSGLGQLIGIVFGGVMAIPITLAILIWGLQKDPFKVAKMVPEEYKFLLPQKLQGKKQVAVRGPDLAQAASLDSLPAADPATANGDAATATPGADPAAAAGSGQAGEKPMKQPGLDDLANSVNLDPATGEPAKPAATEPAPDPAPAPPAPPEPEPLDLSGLEAAVAEATTALEAVPAADAADKKARIRAVASWYKAMAKVAEELAMLERVAADSGRPLETAPEQFVALHAAVASEPSLMEELGEWGRNWIGFKKRSSAGIVLPVTFDSATRLGPFWSAKVLLDDGNGAMTELAIVSRSEPAALAGDRVIVTGLLLDGDVIWATDVRKPSTEKPSTEKPAAEKPAASALDDESF